MSDKYREKLGEVTEFGYIESGKMEMEVICGLSVETKHDWFKLPVDSKVGMLEDIVAPSVFYSFNSWVLKLLMRKGEEGKCLRKE